MHLSHSFHPLHRGLWPLALTLALLAMATMNLPGRGQEGNAALPSFEAQLRQHAPEIIADLRKREIAQVGVLKFLVQKDGYERQDNVGTFNLLAAERLEAALGVANRADKVKQIGLLRKASDVAATIPGATVQTPDGRSKLFTKQYPPSFGKPPLLPLAPDAFVTGIVRIDNKLRYMTVILVSIEKPGAGPHRKLAQFRASLDAPTLNEVDEPFHLRGGFDGGKVTTTATESALQVRADAAARFPLNEAGAPVGLEVRYDGRTVAPEFRDGRAVLQEPQQGQAVEFVLRRNQRGSERLAVVLKVNGESTISREQRSDVDCSKWILEPDCHPFRITGYQMNLGEAAKFRVASEEESQQLAMNFGVNTGTISLTVFRELKEPPALDISDEAEDIAAILHAAFPAEPPADAMQLKAHLLRGQGRIVLKGLIAKGESTRSEVQEVAFRADPDPVLSATIRYYKR